MIDLNTLNIKELHELYINKKTTVAEVVGLYLKNIEEKNKTINAFVEVFSDIDE